MTEKRKRTQVMPRGADFTEDMCDTITSFCMLGATNEELAELMEVTRDSIQRWYRNNPKFKAAVQAGREVADAKVAKSLYRRAIGYSHSETVVSVTRENGEAKIIQTEITRNYPPDTHAASYWLTMRRKDKWRLEKNAEPETTPEQIAADAQRVIAQAMATSSDAARD